MHRLLAYRLLPTYHVMDTVPKLPPCSEAVDRRLLCDLPSGVIGAAKGHDQPVCHRAMFPAVQSDVPIQIIPEVLQPAVRLDVQLVHNALKDRGQQVFPTEREGRGDGAEVSFFDDGERLLNKTAGAFGNFGRFEGE